MATNLGKRKRGSPEPAKSRKDNGDLPESVEPDAQEIFRRHFEARFKPLPVVKKPVKVVEETPEDGSEAESEWDGISDNGETSVQVIEHTDKEAQIAMMSKEQLKEFMSSRPPTGASTVFPNGDKAAATTEDQGASEAANLKNDLALQRLLNESHLLDSSASPTLSGNNRHKAMDLRLQALGSKTSILKQEKMPMTHRRGIVAKQEEKESRRRKEAKENGIILEKVKMGRKASDGRRERGVGAPAIGKFSGGTLKLSKKDIFDIEGPKRSAVGKGAAGGKKARGRRGK